MSIQVRLFGILADTAGKNTISVSDVSDIKSLKEKIFSEYPKTKSHKFLVAVNRKIVNKNIAVSEEDDIALLPPFSGG